MTKQIVTFRIFENAPKNRQRTHSTQSSRTHTANRSRTTDNQQDKTTEVFTDWETDAATRRQHIDS